MESLINSIKEDDTWKLDDMYVVPYNVHVRDYINSDKDVVDIKERLLPSDSDDDIRIANRKGLMKMMIDHIITDIYYAINGNKYMKNLPVALKFAELSNVKKHFVVAYKNVITKYGPTRILCIANNMPMTEDTKFKIYWSNKLVNEFIDKYYKVNEKTSRWNYGNGKFILLPTGAMFYIKKTENNVKCGTDKDRKKIDFNSYLSLHI
jgi:hypothetical protein